MDKIGANHPRDGPNSRGQSLDVDELVTHDALADPLWFGQATVDLHPLDRRQAAPQQIGHFIAAYQGFLRSPGLDR